MESFSSICMFFMTMCLDLYKVWNMCLVALSVRQQLMGSLPFTSLHRFSAFWLRSKCSICSYQLNIWYEPHVGSTILNWFLDHGEVLGACSTFAADRPGIAVPPGLVHSPRGEKIQTIKNEINTMNCYFVKMSM